MSSIKISVITATFNSANTIRGVIDSLEGQTVQDFEWIVIDGGSTDNTLDLIESSKISCKVVLSEPDSGIYNALNKGLSLVKGDFFTFLHSDDMWDNPHYLETYFGFASDKPGVVYSNAFFINKDGDISRIWRDPCTDAKDIYRGWMPPHVSLMVNSCILTAGGFRFNEAYSISADYDWVLRLTKVYPCVDWCYAGSLFVTMRGGGASNGSIAKYLMSYIEDTKIVIVHFGFWYFFIPVFKRLRKLRQWGLHA